MHRCKVDPGVSELPRGNELSRDHVNRPKVLNKYYFNHTKKQFSVTTNVYSDFSKLGCLWELIIGETNCIVFDLKRYGK